MAARLLCGMAFWLVPDGALVPLGAVWVVVGVAWAGWLAVCAQAGAATSIVVISSGAARWASVHFHGRLLHRGLAADAT